MDELARKARLRVFVERAVAAHFLSYPIGFVWAVASMPPAMHFHHAAIVDAATRDDPSVANLLVRDAIGCAVVVMLVLHLTALPWALEKVPGAGKRFFWRAVAVSSGVGVASALAGWGWIFLR